MTRFRRQAVVSRGATFGGEASSNVVSRHSRVPMQTATGSKFLPDRELMSKWPPMFHVSRPKCARRNMTAKFLCLNAFFVAASSVGTADTIPLPRARPEIVPGQRSPTPATAVPPSPCQLRLAELAVFEPLSPITGPGECTATDVVKVDAVLLPDKRQIVFSPPVTLRCPLADAVAQWISNDVAPTIAALGTSLRSVESLDSFDCRPRNGIAGAQVSEHGHANALDVRSFELASGGNHWAE